MILTFHNIFTISTTGLNQNKSQKNW